MRKHWERRDVLKTLGAGSAYSIVRGALASAQTPDVATLVLRNGRFTTLDPGHPDASAVATVGNRFAAVGGDKEVVTLLGPQTRVIDLEGRRVVPGLIDSHTHVIRGGL